jgi:hypothetical protein
VSANVVSSATERERRKGAYLKIMRSALQLGREIRGEKRAIAKRVIQGFIGKMGLKS